MQFKRYALPALMAFTLAACGDDSGPTGSGGLSDAQRFALAEQFAQAATHAENAEAYNASYGFYMATMGTFFGSGTAQVSATSNGAASLIAAGSPAAVTAGAYQVMGISIRSIDDYGSYVDTTETSMIIAYRDTTNLIAAYGEGTSGTFQDEEVFGFIYDSPDEWVATSGTASLTNMQVGGDCAISSAVRTAIEAEMDASTTWTCNSATFNGSINVTASTPSNATAEGSRTVSLSRNGLPGIRITMRWTAPTAR